MSDVVENISEQQNSAPSTEVAALEAEASAEVTKNVEETSATETAVPASAKETNIGSADVPVEDDKKTKAEAASKDNSPVVADNKKTPAKRTPSKRLSFIERAQRESEELVKNMGGSLEMEGGRRTRSSARGTPTRAAAASTPPPAKKARTSPAAGATTPTRGRARGRKLDTSMDMEEETVKSTPTPSKKQKTPAKVRGRGSAAAAAAIEKEAEEDNESVDETPPVGVESKEKTDDKNNEKSDKCEKDEETVLNEKDNVKKDIDESVTPSSHKEVEPTIAVAETKTDTESENKQLQEEAAETPQQETSAVEESAVVAKSDEDKTDAVLDPVVEETLSQVAEEASNSNSATTETVAITKEMDDVVLVQSESETNDDSRMDDDDVVELVENSNAGKDVQSVAEAAVVETVDLDESSKKADDTVVIGSKDTTPEPMEVDSSSDSNDVVEKMDDDVTVVEGSKEPVNATDNVNDTDTRENEKASTVENSIVSEDNVVVLPHSASTLDGIANSEAANNSLEAKTSSVEGTSDPITNNDNKAEEEIEADNSTTPAANDTNKNENDLCEPKIATSPPISAANDKTAVTTTPQICN